MPRTIAIIGAGAAGMMAAATILESHPDHVIHLFDKNPSLGRKVVISGGGRCNVTTGITDRKVLMTKYTRGAQFLSPALTAFTPARVRSWFEQHGVPLKCEEDLRVFPVSDDGNDVVRAFERVFRAHDVRTHLRDSVTTLTHDGTNFVVTASSGIYSCDAVIVTTGGNAYRHTGSSGDGYDFARAFGHTITPLGPSLNSFETAQSWCKELSGLSMPDAQWSVTVDGTKHRVHGPMLFTHFGVSGPSTFALSSRIAFAPISKQQPLTVAWSPIADRDFQSWDEQFLSATQENGRKHVLTFLAQTLPRRLASTLLTLAAIHEDTTLANLTKELRKRLIHLLSGELTLTFLSRRAGDEFVTAGGVVLDEVDPTTMQSRLRPGLFFAGEVLDVDGVTGGFNLQASWATGRLAGTHAAQ